MNVLRAGFVGTRTGEVAATTAFFRDLIGLEVRRDDTRSSILQLPTGRFDFVEGYKSAFADRRLAPADVPLFVAFIVDDVESARAEALAYGATVGDIVWPEGGVRAGGVRRPQMVLLVGA